MEKHKKWISDIECTQCTQVYYPMLADPEKKVSLLYGMIHPNEKDLGCSMTVRSVFIIDHKKKLRLIMTYPASTGRNFVEVLRVIDSL